MSCAGMHRRPMSLGRSVLSSTDNFLRPILIRRAVSLPMILILAGVLDGVLSIGVAGLFIGPVFLAVTYHLLLASIDLPEGSRIEGGGRQAVEATAAVDKVGRSQLKGRARS